MRAFKNLFARKENQSISKENAVPIKESNVTLLFPLLDLSQDILANNFQKQLPLQELGRLARTCKGLNSLFKKELAERKLELYQIAVIDKTNKSSEENNEDESYYIQHPIASGTQTMRLSK